MFDRESMTLTTDDGVVHDVLKMLENGVRCKNRETGKTFEYQFSRTFYKGDKCYPC